MESPKKLPKEPSVARNRGRARPRAAGPELTWPGKTWTAGGHDGAGDEELALRTVESPIDDAPSGRLIQGDALEVARALGREEAVKGAVDVIYFDPPFASQEDYIHEARLDGTAGGRTERSFAFGDKWTGSKGGDDGIGQYLDHLAPRLEAAALLLSRRGSLWVHVDWRAAYLVRVLLDEIMGRDAFLNEIVWRRAPNLGRQATSHQFGRTLDTIVVYGGKDAVLVPPTRPEPIEAGAVKFDPEGRPFTTAPRGDYTDDSIARLDAEGRIHRSSSGQVYVKYFCQKAKDGSYTRERRVDSLWTDIPPLRHTPASERTGFPTQKPEALLERIVACATPPGGLAVDLFSGSGTTGVAAFTVGRRFILGDRSPTSIATSRARLLRRGAALSVEKLVGAGEVAPKTHIDVACQVVKRSGDAVTIELTAPKEPLAWAIGEETADGVFRYRWHSERGLGKKPTPVETHATVPVATRPYAVRVYRDDGAEGALILPHAAKVGERAL